MNIEQKIKELETQLETLKVEINQKKWPEVGEHYFLWADGVTEGSTKAIESTFRALNQGNLFHTKEEAEKERDTRETISQYQRLGRKFICGRENCCVVLHFNPNGACYLDTWNRDSVADGLFDTYFDTKEDITSAIKQVTMDKLLSAAKWRALGE